MKFNVATLGLLGLIAGAYAEVYMSEKFEDETWIDRWTASSHRADLGKLELTASQWFTGSDAGNKGLKTSEDHRFYAISTPVKSVFDNKGKNFVAQFSLKHDQKVDCGGGYIKILKPDFNAKEFSGDTEYNVMFGPDICGTKSLIHVILNYNGANHDLKKTIPAPNDQFTHFYTLIIKPDQTYQVLVDGEEKGSGNLLEDWDLLPLKTIPDPDAKKPEDWVDEATIPDPDDKKPDNWDNAAEFIPDPDAKKPEDWDDEMDGDWEPPSIPNPDFQGEWSPKTIENPAYKGAWEHPIIDNPDYKVNEDIYAYKTGGIGIDIWQVKSGSIFDDFLLTDEIELAAKEREHLEELKVTETSAKEAFEKAEEDAKKAEEPASTPEDIDEVDAEFEPTEEESSSENVHEEL